jgi:hypothetical protein
MKLPHLDNAVVPHEKTTGYLLSSTHRDGRHKAAFFTSFGFAVARWHDLAKALLQHAADHDVTREEDSPFGRRYVIEGIMRAPDGRTPLLRTVWFIETGAAIPRFVTAYPLRRQDDD